MGKKVGFDAVYVASQDIVAREIEGELLIIPIVSGIGNMEDGIFTLNDAGKAIWESLDGKKTLRVIAGSLSKYYKASIEEIEKDVLGFAEELFKRKIIIESR